MKLEKIDLEEANCFSSIFLDYINREEKLKPFYQHYPAPENFQKQIEAKASSFDSQKRKTLQEVINQQYEGLEKSARFIENLKQLEDEKTFTVTTGHQLNIFTGPLYFIYKIVTTINLAASLNERYPHFNFIPVYWMASEDHDFAEINHFRLFDQKYQWQTEQQGAVGRFRLEGMEQLIKDLPEVHVLFERAYLNQDNLADATRYIANELFGKQGLVVLDADHRQLKSEFADMMHQDILEENSNRLVETTSEKLNQAGYKNQVFSRKINFFYLDENLRGRLVRENGEFEVLDSPLKFSPDEFEKIVKKTPEKISPNVITRPLYQEAILPNIAYIGGPAEVAYWLQLKEVFQHYQVPFPIIMPRNFALVVNKSSTKKLYKLEIKPADLFLESHLLKERYILQNGEGSYQLNEQKKKLEQLFAEIVNKAEHVDKSLTGAVGSEQSKAEKILDNLEKRLKKAEEKNQEVAVRQVQKLKEKLFPQESLQERKDNFLNFYLNDQEFLQKLMANFDPFDYRFNILIEE